MADHVDTLDGDVIREIVRDAAAQGGDPKALLVEGVITCLAHAEANELHAMIGGDL
jgi:hypothetical protein